MTLKLSGISLGMVTPFTTDNEVDTQGIKRNLDFALGNGVHSLSPCATSGEGSLLSADEYENALRTVIEFTNAKVPVTPGAPGGAPGPIIKIIKLAKDLGADGVYLSTPAYTKPTQEGLFAHFSKILSSADVPIIIYNAVHRSAVDMSPEVVRRLSEEFSNFVGYKEPSLLKMAKIKHFIGERIQLMCEDWLSVPALALGASGVASVVANVVPRIMVEMYNAFVEGNMPKARELQIKLIPLMDTIGTGAGGSDTSPAPIKAAMNMLGLAAGAPRLPVVESSKETIRELKIILPGLIPSMKVV